ncbi:MAG TPA: hypothetical protein P5340_00100 [Defluviicoccus sp.]|nr:hypothetical protein [Defluviicoccus sp.]
MTPEFMPDGDDISRWIFYPHMSKEDRELIWDNVFMFPSGRPESVVWRRYLKSIGEVHEKGCEREKERNTRPERADKKLQRYYGAISAKVLDIRKIRNLNKHGFRVEHDPSEKEGIYHVHISYDVSQGYDFTKQDKIELKSRLKAVFSDLLPHACEH